MPEIKPFRAIMYNPARVEIGEVVAPPYDVISPEQREELYNQGPYNIVRLILGRIPQGGRPRCNPAGRPRGHPGLKSAARGDRLPVRLPDRGSLRSSILRTNGQPRHTGFLPARGSAERCCTVPDCRAPPAAPVK